MGNAELGRKRQELAAARRRKAAIKQTIANLKKTIAELEAKPKLPHPNRSMIGFRKRFLRNGPDYMYVAVEINERWYVSGTTGPQNVTWDRLADFIEKDNLLTPSYSPLTVTHDVFPS